MPDTFWERMGTITPTEEHMDSSSAGRVHFWRVAVAMANANPILGVGHAAYNVAYDQYDYLSGAYGTGRSVHSAWFGVLSELGYPGAALFCASVALAFLACARVRRLASTGNVSPELGRYAIAIEASLAAFAAGGSFVIFQYVEMLWHLIGLSIALNYLAVTESAAPRPAVAATASG